MSKNLCILESAIFIKSIKIDVDRKILMKPQYKNTSEIKYDTEGNKPAAYSTLNLY